MYIDKPLHEYLDDLAARKPAPGGGSAAALSASLGASLMSMVANYTVGNPKYKDKEEDVRGILEKIKGFRTKLKDLIDLDVEAYEKLSRAIKEFKNDPSKLDGIYKEAVEVPFQICRTAGSLLRLCVTLVDFGNKNLITDTATAAILLEGAFFSAKFNVYINLKFMKDLEYIEKIHKLLSPLEEEMPKLKEEILHKCEDCITR